MYISSTTEKVHTFSVPTFFTILYFRFTKTKRVRGIPSIFESNIFNVNPLIAIGILEEIIIPVG
jgi:hypothetical protein